MMIFLILNIFCTIYFTILFYFYHSNGIHILYTITTVVVYSIDICIHPYTMHTIVADTRDSRTPKSPRAGHTGKPRSKRVHQAPYLRACAHCTPYSYHLKKNTRIYKKMQLQKYTFTHNPAQGPIQIPTEYLQC